jgi:hypothetical protein
MKESIWISDIPFGMMVIDGKEVGIELVNHNNIQNFYACIFIKDENIATNIKEFYLKMWNSAYDNNGISNLV